MQQTILDSPEFQKFAAAARDLTAEWFAAHRDALADIDADTKPNDLIGAISDDLLARFKPVPLLDEYDVYEQLMTYWHDVMHDDVFLIMNDGWLEAAKPRKAIEDKDRKLTETPDLVIGSGRSATKYKMDLIPPALIVARYFAERAGQDRRTHRRGRGSQPCRRGVHRGARGEDGLLAEAMDDDKITKALATARLKEAKKEGSDPDEIKALEHLLKLYDAEADAKKAVKEAQAELDLATLKQYGNLTEDDVKTLVLDDKWQATITGRIAREVEVAHARSRRSHPGARRAVRRDRRALDADTRQARSQGRRSSRLRWGFSNELPGTPTAIGRVRRSAILAKVDRADREAGRATMSAWHVRFRASRSRRIDIRSAIYEIRGTSSRFSRQVETRVVPASCPRRPPNLNVGQTVGIVGIRRRVPRRHTSISASRELRLIRGRHDMPIRCVLL